jgi:predicted benzoate:H+ symporter BenE
VSFAVLLGDADRRIAAAATFAMQAFGVSLLAIGSRALVLVPGCIP